MSILSCEKISDEFGHEIEVVEEKNALELKFFFGNKKDSSYDSVSINTVNTGVWEGQRVNVYNGAGNMIHNGYVSNATTSSNIVAYHTVGLRLFFKNGYLQCVKKEVSHVTLISASSMPDQIVGASMNTRNSLISPIDMVNSIGSAKLMEVLGKKILDFAERRGIKVPEKFIVSGIGYTGINRTHYYSYLDWLSFPLVREIDSVALSKNLSQTDRSLLRPSQAEPMTFVRLVDHYYGTHTSKMLKEIWDILTFGNDFKQTVFQQSVIDNMNGQIDALVFRAGDVVETHDNYVVQTGDRCLNSAVFTFGPCVFKAMGFDFFYKWIKSLGDKALVREMVKSDYTYGHWEANIKYMLTHLSVRKLGTLIVGNVKDLHYMGDIVRMLQDYPDANEIPLSLKPEFPNGLQVDFKFKTFKELHDKISTQYTIIEMEASKKDIPVHPIYALLNGMEHGGCKLIVPTNTTFLAIWGKLLSICVASYGDRAARADALILGVEKEGEIKYCIEFSPVIMAMMKQDEIVGIISEATESPTALMDNTVRVAIPAIEERACGVVPEGESDTYLAPHYIQFRGQRNCDPDKTDESSVTLLLCKWLEGLAKGTYDELGPKAFYSQRNFFTNDNFQNFVNNAVGQPDQLIINPADHQALINALAVNVPLPVRVDAPPANDMIDAIQYQMVNRVAVDDVDIRAEPV